MKRTIYLLAAIIFFSIHSLNAQWVKTNGPEGIFVTSFFNEDSILLCGTFAQGVYRSYDHGNSWVASNTGLQLKEVDCFAKDSLYMYAGVFGEGVYRSSDYGYTWQPANNGIPAQAVYCLLVGGGYVFAGTIGGGVFRSDDNGNTWVDASGGAISSSFIKAMVYRAPRLMVEADNYIFYSFDFGNSWYVDQGTTQFYVINSFFQKGDTLLAAAQTNLFRSTDGGVNWSTPYMLNSSVVGYDRKGDTVYAGTADGVYQSLNWGQTWSLVSSTGLRHGLYTACHTFIASGTNFLLGYEEIGVYKSANTGVTWSQTPLSDFARASCIDDAMIFANGTLYSGTHGNGVYSSPDYGNTWNKIGTANPSDTLSNEIIFSMLHIPPNILLAGGCGTGLFRSGDNGQTWAHIFGGLPQQAGTGFCCINSLAMSGPNVIAATTEGVYYSTDNGLTWNSTNISDPSMYASGVCTKGNVSCVGITAFPTPSGIYRSTNNGVSWTMSAPVIDVIRLTAGGSTFMYEGSLFDAAFSNDNGFTWFNVGPGIPAGGGAFTILSWDNYVFIGNNFGVFFSDNYAASFTDVSQGMEPYPNNSVQGLTRDSVYVYAGMYRDAVWRRPLSDFGITTNTVYISHPQENFTVYAEPLQGRIKINFPLNAEQKNSLVVYNSAGQAVLSYGSMEKSMTHVDFNGENGMYIAVLHSSGKTYTAKFTWNRTR